MNMRIFGKKIQDGGQYGLRNSETNISQLSFQTQRQRK